MSRWVALLLVALALGCTVESKVASSGGDPAPAVGIPETLPTPLATAQPGTPGFGDPGIARAPAFRGDPGIVRSPMDPLWSDPGIHHELPPTFIPD